MATLANNHNLVLWVTHTSLKVRLQLICINVSVGGCCGGGGGGGRRGRDGRAKAESNHKSKAEREIHCS